MFVDWDGDTGSFEDGATDIIDEVFEYVATDVIDEVVED